MKSKVPISKQKPDKRTKNFKEVCLGYTQKEAQMESSRCLFCKDKPCVKGCPVGIDIPGFIKKIKEGKNTKALEIIREKNMLPGICGRVCPQEEQCEKVCRLAKISDPIAIGKLERFASDFGEKKAKDRKKATQAKNSFSENIKVAVVGSGPASLTCASELAKKGYSVTVFEALHLAGGVLRYGIPEFRLPDKIIDEEIESIKSLGVDFKTDIAIGFTLSIEDLFRQEYKAIFLGIGAGLPYFMNIEGENLNGIYSSNEFLTRANLMQAYKNEYDTPIKTGRKVIVIGGGNTAIDSARVAKRIGAKEVIIAYRRSEEEMPARDEEIENAVEEGIVLRLLTNPIKFIGDKEGNVESVECIKMKLGESDKSGRKRPIPIKGSNFNIKADTVIVAIGQGPNPILSKRTPDLKIDKKGYFQIDDKNMTSIEGVFAAGDIVSGKGTVIAAMGDAKKTAHNMDEYIKNKFYER